MSELCTDFQTHVETQSIWLDPCCITNTVLVCVLAPCIGLILASCGDRLASPSFQLIPLSQTVFPLKALKPTLVKTASVSWLRCSLQARKTLDSKQNNKEHLVSLGWSWFPFIWFKSMKQITHTVVSVTLTHINTRWQLEQQPTRGLIWAVGHIWSLQWLWQEKVGRLCSDLTLCFRSWEE